MNQEIKKSDNKDFNNYSKLKGFLAACLWALVLSVSLSHKTVLAARSSDSRSNSTSFSEAKVSPLDKCLQQALVNLTAASRDRALFACMQKHVELRGSSCAAIAQRFEYQTSVDQALSFCLNERTSNLNADACDNFAKKFLFEINEDESRWTCLLNKVSDLSRSDCDRIAHGIHSIPSKKRALDFCSSRATKERQLLSRPKAIEKQLFSFHD